jgi:hypothetical protein
MTLMRNGRDRRSETPFRATRGKNACFCLGPISGSHQGQRPQRLHSKAGYMAAPERFAKTSDSFPLHRGRRPYMARMRHSKIADGRPLSGEERSCSGHHCNDRAWTHCRPCGLDSIAGRATGRLLTLSMRWRRGGGSWRHKVKPEGTIATFCSAPRNAISSSSCGKLRSMDAIASTTQTTSISTGCRRRRGTSGVSASWRVPV